MQKVEQPQSLPGWIRRVLGGGPRIHRFAPASLLPPPAQDSPPQILCLHTTGCAQGEERPTLQGLPGTGCLPARKCSPQLSGICSTSSHVPDRQSASVGETAPATAMEQPCFGCRCPAQDSRSGGRGSGRRPVSALEDLLSGEDGEGLMGHINPSQLLNSARSQQMPEAITETKVPLSKCQRCNLLLISSLPP